MAKSKSCCKTRLTDSSMSKSSLSQQHQKPTQSEHYEKATSIVQEQWHAQSSASLLLIYFMPWYAWAYPDLNAGPLKCKARIIPQVLRVQMHRWIQLHQKVKKENWRGHRMHVRVRFLVSSHWLAAIEGKSLTLSPLTLLLFSLSGRRNVFRKRKEVQWLRVQQNVSEEKNI